MPATAPKVSFLLRQPRVVQGYREALGPNQPADHALTMVWIPPGRFWMGSPATEADRTDAEGPQHLVQVQGFFMAQTPITQAQWRAVANLNEGPVWRHELKPNPSLFHPDHWQGKDRSVAYTLGGLLDGEVTTDDRPVERVSWHEALEFCHRLGRLTGRGYTLPSEAQWEYACRAGSPEAYGCGATLAPGLANVRWQTGTAISMHSRDQQQTTPVRMYPANAWGLYDMHGNVGEWCFDHWRERYEAASVQDAPWLIKDDRELLRDRVIRGGSWNWEAAQCRSASRIAAAPHMRDMRTGFRLVCLTHLSPHDATQHTGDWFEIEREAQIPIGELKLPAGSVAALKKAGINVLPDLMGFSYEDLLDIPGIDIPDADGIIAALERAGISLPQERIDRLA